MRSEQNGWKNHANPNEHNKRKIAKSERAREIGRDRGSKRENQESKKAKAKGRERKKYGKSVDIMKMEI